MFRDLDLEFNLQHQVKAIHLQFVRVICIFSLNGFPVVLRRNTDVNRLSHDNLNS